MSKATTCTNHCGRCGRHFHSVAAFDAHRQGKHMPKKGERGRRCVDPEDAADSNGEDLFEELTTNGFCILNGGMQKRVTIWTLKISLDNEEVFKRLRRTHKRSRR